MKSSHFVSCGRFECVLLSELLFGLFFQLVDLLYPSAQVERLGLSLLPPNVSLLYLE